MDRNLDISVLMPTHNRAAILRDTLEAMTRVRRDGLEVEFVVVDNASTDDTREVIGSYAKRLPVRRVYEPRPGKNRALNRALAEAELGRIVVFTDDDVTPRRDWLLAIHDVCARRPEYSVFGGQIHAVWPSDKVPGWALDPFIHAFGFAHHDYAKEERPYAPDEFPFGPNYWVRREVFADGLRFYEHIGPHPRNRILGDETLFLKQLRGHGFEPFYTPKALVGHRIQPENFSAAAIVKRAATLGRGAPVVNGLCQADLLHSHPHIWRLRRRMALWWYALRYLRARLTRDHDRQVVRSVHAIFNMAYNRASLELARHDGHLPDPNPSSAPEASSEPPPPAEAAPPRSAEPARTADAAAKKLRSVHGSQC